MRIAILADPIDNQYGGVHVYTRNLVEALLKENSRHEYFLIRPKALPHIEGAETIVVPKSPGFATLRLFLIIPWIIRRRQIDCVIEPAHFGPFNLPDHIARITFIHDMTPILFPHLHPWTSQVLQRMFFPRILRQATRVITNSKHTAQDVIRLFPGTRDKVITNYLGVETNFQPMAQPGIPLQYGITSPYILSVATIEPRKNLDLLLDVYTRFRTTIQDRVQLVISGKRGWKYHTFFTSLASHPFREDIILTDYIPRDHLPVLYSLAFAFVYPSKYEGFGLPVAEAMQCGTPCVVSHASSLPEVGGDAVLYGSPDSADEFCTQLCMLYQDNGLRHKLIQAGQAQVKQFTWAQHAQVYSDVFEEIERGEGQSYESPNHPITNHQSPPVCIIILNWNRPGDTIRCLESLWPMVERRQAAVIICDNASTDDSEKQISAWIREQVTIDCIDELGDWSVIIQQTGANRGYAAGNNVGIRLALAEARFDYIWLLNNDTVLAPDTLEHLLACADHQPDAAVIGSTIVDEDNRNRIQCAGGCRYSPATTIMLPALNGKSVEKVLQQPPQVHLDYISGAAMFIRVQALKKIGLLNEQYFLYYEEADLAQRMRRHGYTLAWCPQSIVYHAGARSTGHAATSWLVGYHENWSTLQYTADYYPWFLPFAAACRFLGKTLIYTWFRRGRLFAAMLTAYGDFFGLSPRPSSQNEKKDGCEGRMHIVGKYRVKG